MPPPPSALPCPAVRDVRRVPPALHRRPAASSCCAPLPLSPALNSTPARLSLRPSPSPAPPCPASLLQTALPNARVLYSSATGASEPNNLRYMVRLGTFGYRCVAVVRARGSIACMKVAVCAQNRGQNSREGGGGALSMGLCMMAVAWHARVSSSLPAVIPPPHTHPDGVLPC